MQTGQNSIELENSLPQLGQVRLVSVLILLTALQRQPQPTATSHSHRVVRKPASTASGILWSRCTSNRVFRQSSAFNHVSEQNSATGKTGESGRFIHFFITRQHSSPSNRRGCCLVPRTPRHPAWPCHCFSFRSGPLRAFARSNVGACSDAGRRCRRSPATSRGYAENLLSIHELSSDPSSQR